MEKLFVVIRNDLPPGLQLAQGIHAAIKYVLENEKAARKWYESSNNLAVLQVPDEKSLELLVNSALEEERVVAPFREPDLDESLTATAFEFGARGFLGSLPLALRPQRLGSDGDIGRVDVHD